MELLIPGDSLPLGRPKHGISRFDTWPYLLASKTGSSLIFRANSASTLLDVQEEARLIDKYWFGDLKTPLFDAAFVQAGIVDTCPRLLPRTLFPLIRLIPGYRILLRARYLHNILGRPWVNDKQFTQTLRKLHVTLSKISHKVYFLEIAHPAHNLLKNVGNFSDSVSKRNQFILDTAGEYGFIQCWRNISQPEDLLPDGHHLSIRGHSKIALACADKLSQKPPPNRTKPSALQPFKFTGKADQ